MREDDGRKLDHATLEAMRLRAVRRIEAGARVEDVATALGLSRSAVFGWMAAYREGGEQALRAKPVPGRPPKLSGAQLRTLYTLIEGSDPRQYQLEFALWTRELVQQLIWAQFRVRLSVVSVGRLLRTLGFSPQARATPNGVTNKIVCIWTWTLRSGMISVCGKTMAGSSTTPRWKRCGSAR